MKNPLFILEDLRQGQPPPANLPSNLDPLWGHLFQILSQSPTHSLSETIASLTTAQLQELEFAVLFQFIRLQNVLLTPLQAEILAFILQNGPATQKTITRAVGQDSGNTHRRLTALTKKELIARAYHNQRIHYHLTIEPSP